MVRSALPEDAGVIAELLAQLGYPTAPEDVDRRLRALGPDDVVLLADDTAGLIALHRVPLLAEGGALVRITALVVRSEMRGRGVARQLLEACEQAHGSGGAASSRCPPGAVQNVPPLMSFMALRA
jgi:GNAT superfamily N-acetyltransferase